MNLDKNLKTKGFSSPSLEDLSDKINQFLFTTPCEVIGIQFSTEILPSTEWRRFFVQFYGLLLYVESSPFNKKSVDKCASLLLYAVEAYTGEKPKSIKLDRKELVALFGEDTVGTYEFKEEIN